MHIQHLAINFSYISLYLGNLAFQKGQTVFFFSTLWQTNNLLPFSRKSVLLYIFNFVGLQFEYLPLTFKVT